MCACVNSVTENLDDYYVEQLMREQWVDGEMSATAHF